MSRKRLPEWLKRDIPTKGEKGKVESILKKGNLVTVCEEAKCPNRAECYCGGTATFLVMGEVCSRNCAFCSVGKGTPKLPDPEEPAKIAAAIKEMGLSYAVITMVTRDDLKDGGASHIADIVRAVKKEVPEVSVEVLVSDMGGDINSLKTIVDSGVDVFNHNVEMAPSLYKKMRPEGEYSRSLSVLTKVKDMGQVPVKTGFMVGLGETDDEVHSLLKKLKSCGIDIVTIGQYLRPSKSQVEVDRFVTPEQFEEYRMYGESLGIPHVESSPFVRSSYNASKIEKKLHQI
jgi:lipoic acid synthetase